MNSLFCLSSPKPIHRSDKHNTKDLGVTPMRLIIGYMRSGSSLTFDLARHTSGDFHIFEPLHGISEATRLFATTQFLNGTRRFISTRDLESISAELIYHWFTCNFNHVDLHSLTDPFIVKHTPDHKDYYQCIANRSIENELEIVKRCTELLRVQCTSARTRTIKTVRLPVFMAGNLLKWLPKLKIVHIIRDPRGILNSQFKLKINVERKLNLSAKTLCNRISRDLAAFDNLKHCHKDRMMSIIYEDLCQHPHIIVPKLYKFFNIEYTKHLKDYVRKITTGRVRPCQYCTDKGNALANAYRWLNIIKEKSMNTIDLHCSFLYSKLGYIHLEFNKLNVTKFSWFSTTNTKHALNAGKKKNIRQ